MQKETAELFNWKLNTAVFLSSQGITLFGSMLVHYAVQWHITLTTQSGVAMMLLSISIAVPIFLISPFAGVWADRYSKKLLINSADAGVAVVSLFMAVMFSLGFEHIALLMACVAARGLGQGIQTPAVGSFIPEITPSENLIQVNGVNSSIQSATAILAPIAGGVLITFMPVQTALFVDVVTAAIGISMLIFFVKAPAREKRGGRNAAWRDMAEGLSYIRGRAFVMKLIFVEVMFSLMFAPAAILTPLQTVRDFGPEPWRLVAIELAFFIGMTVSGALIGVFGGFKNKSHTMALATAIAGFSIIGLGLMEFFAPYLVFMGICGLTMPAFDAPMRTVLQVKVDAEYMGRVFSVIAMLGSIMTPIGMTVWGPLADIVPIDLLLIISGACIIGIGAYFISDKTLREAGRP